MKTSLYITDELLKKVDEYRFKNKIDSRNTAIIQLIEKGLAVK
jgi:metal-responsive CopG/Arc/MetJ family transcriptional regulator